MSKVKRTSPKTYHPPYFKFQGYMKENRITLKEIGDLLGGLTVQTISAKNNGRSDYRASEINMICDRYGVSADLFRTQKVS
jgi:transcriptional regulator with XRE-family HTH domain